MPFTDPTKRSFPAAVGYGVAVLNVARRIIERFISFGTRNPAWAGYTLALVGTPAAAWVRWELGRLVGPDLPPYIIFYPVVILSALLGGTGAGLLACVLSAGFVDYLFLQPHGFGISSPVEMAGMGIFTILNLMLSLAGGALRRFQRRTEQQARELVRTVDLLNADIVRRKTAEEDLKRTEQALRDSEGRFRGVFENAAAGVAMVRLDGRFLSVNDTLCRMTGYTRDELYAVSFGAITHPDDREMGWEQARRLFAGEMSSYMVEKRCIRSDGATVWINLCASLQRNAQGQAQYGIAVVSDITERKRAEAALSRAHEQLAVHVRDLDALVEQRTSELRDVAQQLETFSYSIAHDLRAPLRIMQSFSELLEQDYGARLDDTARDYLRRIVRSATRMDGLITDVLAYSRVTRGHAPLSVVNLEQLVTEIIDGFPQFQEQAAAIRVERPLPAVCGNSALLTQVISNLIGNALKFVPPGRAPRVNVGAIARGGRVRVWVQDQGIGIPAEHQHKLFGLFQRLHSSSEYPGTGVGLATVKRAIERMGGEVGFESESGVGTRFWFDLRSADSESTGCSSD